LTGDALAGGQGFGLGAVGGPEDLLRGQLGPGAAYHDLLQGLRSLGRPE
jgi:hypothetical protein